MRKLIIAAGLAVVSVVASGGTVKVPPVSWPPFSSFEQAASTASVVAAPVMLSRKSRRDMPVRRAFSSQAIRVRRAASRASGVAGGGTNSPFEHRPSLIGRPTSSSSTS